MKNNKKRGFTLVELLVVIAILAILATVSVVGYTSFIESANVAVDEDLVAQLNNFLAAYKVNNTEDITADNAWEVTQEILELSGLDKINGLVPKSKDNHFYFNVQEQEYQLVTDTLVTGNGSHFFNIFGFAASNLKPGVFTNDKNQTLFLVDTAGWDVADVVRGFYTLDNYESINAFLDEARAMEGKYSNLAYWAENTVFVTKDGNFVVDLGTPHSHLVVYEDATFIGNTKNDFANVSKPITESKPLLTITTETTIKIPAGIKLPANSLTIDAADGLVTVVIDEASWSTAVKDNIDANFTNDNVVVRLGGRNYKINGNEIHVAETYGNEGVTYVDLLKYNNPMLSFDIMANGVANKVTDSTKEGYVAWDVENGQFTVKVTNAKGNPEKANDPLSITDVIWSVGEGFEAHLEVVDAEKGIFQFKNHEESAPEIDTLTIVATPKIGANGYVDGEKTPQTYTVKLVRAIGISGLKLDTEAVDFENAVVLMNGEKNGETVTNSPFSLVEGGVKIHFNHSAAEGVIVLDDATLSLVANSTFNVSADGKTLTLVDTLGDLLQPETIALNIGKYFTKEISISMFNQYKLNFVENKDNAQIKVVGDDNPITLGDLFKQQVGMDIPTNAQVWFGAGFGGTTTMPGDINMDEYSASRHGTTVTSLNADWTKTPIQFNTGTNNSTDAPEVNVAIVVPTENGYRRISAVRSIKVVDGYNIREGEYATLKEKSDAGNSIVLISDVTMDVAQSYFSIKAGKTFYGNSFTLDVSENGNTGGNEGINAMYGIIELAGRLQDTKVIGKVYGTFAGSANEKYGTNLVFALGGSTISNCYLSNTRAPLVINYGGTVTVEDTVFYGGRYANIDVRQGELVLKGDITTVQQPIEGLDADGNKVSVIGFGIACWFEDYSQVLTFENANLKQYNFMNKSLSESLPPLKYSGFELLNMSVPFNNLFTDTYKEYRFGENKDYVHGGIVSIDKYSLNYNVTRQTIDEDGWIVKKYLYAYTVKLITPVNDADVFTIKYDSSKYKCKTVSDNDGSVDVTGAQLKAGVVLERTSFEYSILGLDFNQYDFYVTSPKYVSMTVNNLNNYVQVNYPYEMGGVFTAGGSIVDFHANGLHYKVLDFDVWTLDNKNEQNKALLDEYIALGDTYKPGVYELTPSVE